MSPINPFEAFGTQGIQGMSNIGAPDIPEALQKQLLLSSILGAGGSLTQGSPVPRSFLQSISGMLSQGTNNYSGALGTLIQMMQEQAKQKMIQDHYAAQNTNLAAQAKLHEAQAGTLPQKSMLDLLKGQLDFTKSQHEYAKTQREVENQNRNTLAEQNLGIYQDPSQFEGMTPQEKEQAMTSVKSALLSQDPKVWNDYKKANTEKEFNIPGDLDSFLAAKAGGFKFDYSTPEGRMGMLKLYGLVPEMAKEFQAWKRDMAPPIYNAVSTSEGILPFSVRGGQVAGGPIGGKPLPNEMITTNQQIGTLKETLDRVKALYKDDYVGPVAGRISGAKEVTIGVPTEQAQFNADVAQIKNSLVYLMSGKQINEQEYQRLAKQLPDKNLPSDVFKARMNTFDKTLDSIVAERQKNSGGYGVNIKKENNRGKIGKYSFTVE